MLVDQWRFSLYHFDVINDFSTSKHWAQITSTFLTELAEIFSHSVGRSLISERQNISNALI